MPLPTVVENVVNYDKDGNIVSPGSDWYHEVQSGNVPGHSIVQKFGSATIGTTFKPITSSLSYRTPQTATQLEVLSTSALDTSDGSGCRKVTITGLDGNWEEIIQVIVTNGITPVQIPVPMTRVYRWFVSESGTYATQDNTSYAGDLTIRETVGGAIWSTILIAPLATAQSQIGVYTVPKGKVGYVLSKNVFVESDKFVDIYFFQRPNADETTAPYSGTKRIIQREVGLTGGYGSSFKGSKGPFVGPCDIGFMGKVTVGTSVVSVEFEILLVDQGF